MAVTAPRRQTLVLRFADVGVATYASLRVVGQPSRTVTWVENVPPLTGTGCFTPLTDRYTDVAVVVPLTVIVRLVAVERSSGLVTESCGAAGGA